MPKLHEIIAEAQAIRRAMDLSDKKGIPLMHDDFPITHCKTASLLLVYHALEKWPFSTLYGVSGIATDHYGNETISHYWIEFDGLAIDITADQYNIIEDRYLNKKIIDSRPFQPVSIGRVGTLPSYEIFENLQRDTYTLGLTELAEDFLEDLCDSYAALRLSPIS
ncbi:hypothetical protein N1E75_22400 [Pseudomonas aeruginosa]|uniref:hypothetical protein n=1 Tax=Pseudomonas aeruginosa TaxID=287 RepID=UPI00093672D5|nr:hypothetical protein [Pseudomonas aeruginosa]ELK4895421.1 hypothetical protein [Pseudomonas aeruginosa]ELQ9077379.1 hypothetical protein [Pseudomonas aeruginosa]MBH8925030.1 hypothetical protein [Pseudomonas aeruginosa]MBS9738230.1 hypothetical protein [Pseudomonas aeruginosa]MCS7808412.1 hypothetical protein [Pseudomonas aeruginosa]